MKRQKKRSTRTGKRCHYRTCFRAAEKLRARADDARLLVEISGRQAWRTYLVTDLAVAFGFARRPVGRPVEPHKVSEALDPSLSRFDAEMAELDAMLARLGVVSHVGDAQT